MDRPGVGQLDAPVRAPRRPSRELIAEWRSSDRLRRRSAIACEAALVVAYLALRVVDAPVPLVVGWTAAAAVVAMVAPVSGLVVLAAVGPFSDPLRAHATLRAVPVLVFATGAGVALRELIERRDAIAAWLQRRPAVDSLRSPLLAAAALAAVTLAGVGYAALRFGPPVGTTSLRQWLFRIGAAMVIVAVACWAARRGERRPFAVLLGSAIAAAIVSLADFVQPNLFANGPFDWLLAPGRNRLAGVIPVATGGASNALAVLMLVPAAVLAAAAIWLRDSRLRIAAAAICVVLLVGVFLTYSRSALLALAVVVVLFAWRIRRRLAVVIVAAAVVAGIVLVPLYLQARGELLGGRAIPSAGSLLTSSDTARLRAWTAGVRMWLDSPVVGQGYGSWPRVRREYGIRRLPNAHNELLMLLAEVGVLGGVAGVAFAASSLRTLWRRRSWLTTGVAAGFTAYCVASNFNGLLGFMQLTIVAFGLLGLGIGYALREQATADQAEADSG